MSTTTLRLRLNRTVGPTTQPLSVADAKKQLEIATDDTSHDDQLAESIEAAREQFEHDTQMITVPQTFEILLDHFPKSDFVRFPVRPIRSLVSVEYVDDDTTLTLDTSIADIDRKKACLCLKPNQSWPTIESRRDAVIITVVAGYPIGACPRIVKQALKLQVSKWFEDRDMFMTSSHEKFDVAYERIIRRLLRSTFP